MHRFNADFLLLISTSALPICMFLMPLSTSMPILVIVISIMGVNMGVIDNLANYQMLQTFKRRVGPFIQVRR